MYNIQHNTYTGGECCYFSADNKFYYADRSETPDYEMETMIFSCSPSGKIQSWTELYCDRSGKSLEECINEFIESCLD